MSERAHPQPAEVHLLRFPLDVWRRAQEHHEELFREFALLTIRRPDHGHEAPRRLLELIDELSDTYAAVTEDADRERSDAIERGETVIDLTYRVPVAAAEASRHLLELLEAADAFCRAGDLLTLATPEEPAAFRRWYLEEFVRQISGEPPLPWPDFATDLVH